MPRDRFVYFDRARAPDRDRVGAALREYLGDHGDVEWHVATHRFYATLPGAPSDPRRHVLTVLDGVEQRWFEVYVHDEPGEAPAVDVMTRAADAYTTAVADGFADLCAELWQGRREA